MRVHRDWKCDLYHVALGSNDSGTVTCAKVDGCIEDVAMANIESITHASYKQNFNFIAGKDIVTEYCIESSAPDLLSELFSLKSPSKTEQAQVFERTLTEAIMSCKAEHDDEVKEGIPEESPHKKPKPGRAPSLRKLGIQPIKSTPEKLKAARSAIQQKLDSTLGVLIDYWLSQVAQWRKQTDKDGYCTCVNQAIQATPAEEVPLRGAASALANAKTKNKELQDKLTRSARKVQDMKSEVAGYQNRLARYQDAEPDRVANQTELTCKLSTATVQVAMEKAKVEELEQRVKQLESSLEGARAEALDAKHQAELALKDVECASDKVKFLQNMGNA